MCKTIYAFLFVLLVISCKKESEFDYPMVFTGDVINLTDTSAIFTAKISNTGAYPIIGSGFIWGVHARDNNGIKIKNETTNKLLFSLPTNVKLLPGKTYYVRAYVQTEYTTSYGREVTFQSNEGTDASGKWKILHDDSSFSWCEYINSSFTIDDKTFFTLQSGALYSYNHATNEFFYEMDNEAFPWAQQSFTYQGNGYIFSNNVLYLFDPQTKSIRQLTILNNSETRYGVAGFIVDDNIYIGLGKLASDVYFKDFWKYNIPTNTWQQVASFPGEFRADATSFSINKTGYVGAGYYSYNLMSNQMFRHNDFWAYIPEKNHWIKKEALPIKNEISSLPAANTAKSGYFFHQGNFFEYNSTFNIWEKRADLDLSKGCPSYMFAANNKIFMLYVKNNDNKRAFKLWVYEE